MTANIPAPHPIFTGREDLLEQIEAVYAGGSRVLFLEGIGGIGKSELAKQYAVRHAADYDQVAFFTFSGNLQETLCDPCKLEITGVTQMEAESQGDFFYRKLQDLRQITDARTLLIVDNFDTDQDPDLEAFLQGSFRVLLTSRCVHPGYRSLTVSAIADMDALLSVFEQHYGEKLDVADKPYIEKLIRKVDCHTYMTELLAKQMQAGFLTGQELLELYDSGDFRQAGRNGYESIEGRSGWQIGDFDNAIKYGNILYQTCLTTHGEASIHTGYCARILGTCYHNGGRMEECIFWYEQSLRSMLASGEEENDDLARAYTCVATGYIMPYRRDFQKALECAENSLAIRLRLKERMEKGEHPPFYVERWRPYTLDVADWGVASAWQKLADVYVEMASYAEALRCAQQASVIMNQVQDVTQASRAVPYHLQGVCHYHLGLEQRKTGAETAAKEELKTARKDLETALQMREGPLGEASLCLQDTKEYLGDVCASLGDYAEAANYYLGVASSLKKWFPTSIERLEAVMEKMNFS